MSVDGAIEKLDEMFENKKMRVMNAQNLREILLCLKDDSDTHVIVNTMNSLQDQITKIESRLAEHKKTHKTMRSLI